MKVSFTVVFKYRVTKRIGGVDVNTHILLNWELNGIECSALYFLWYWRSTEFNLKPETCYHETEGIRGFTRALQRTLDVRLQVV
jgi:hypothetical protein